MCCGAIGIGPVAYQLCNWSGLSICSDDRVAPVFRTNKVWQAIALGLRPRCKHRLAYLVCPKSRPGLTFVALLSLRGDGLLDRSFHAAGDFQAREETARVLFKDSSRSSSMRKSMLSITGLMSSNVLPVSGFIAEPAFQ